MRMGRKNLYIPDEHENLVERLEKSLDRHGQSLSDFFVQSVKNTVSKPLRGDARPGTTKMSLPSGVVCAIAVDSTWRYSNAVHYLIGPSNRPGFKAADSSLIEAKVLASDDPLGLWIELNSERQRDPDRPVLELLIPWRFVLGVCVNPQQRKNVSDLQPTKRFGLPVGAELDITSPEALEFHSLQRLSNVS